MLHLNAQTLGATGEANTLGASVGDLKNPRLAIAETQSGTTFCVTPPAVGADPIPPGTTNRLAERNGTNFTILPPAAKPPQPARRPQPDYPNPTIPTAC